MIRNNQNGRRRGRGGARPPQAGGVPQPSGYNNGGGNRVDVRQRGNAAQLLEKYKAMARDAHQGGDRVAAEYYMQYADHYYRVLNDYRDRQPDQRPQQRRDFDGDDDDQGYGVQPYVQNGQGHGDPRDDDGENDQAPRMDSRQSHGDQTPSRDRDGAQARQRDGNNGERDGNTRDAERGSDHRGNGEARGNGDGRQPVQRRDRVTGPAARETAPAEFEPRGRGDDADRGASRTANRAETRDDYDAPQAFAGIPGPATIAPAAPAQVAEADAPVPRKRGRPRKVVVEAAEPSDA